MRTENQIRRFDSEDDRLPDEQAHHPSVQHGPSEPDPSRELQIREEHAHPNNYGDRPAGMPTALIVLHYTATASLDAAVSWFKNPEAKVSAHYVVDRDGSVVRLVSEVKNAYHTGRSSWDGESDVDRFSIRVELVNWGQLVQRDGGFFTWPNEYTNPYNGADPVFLESEWWEPYPETQLASLRLLIDDIQSRYSIEAVVGRRDVSPGRKIDPGSAFRLPSRSALEVQSGRGRRMGQTSSVAGEDDSADRCFAVPCG